MMLESSADSQSTALWVAWQEDPNDAVREQLVDFYLPFARMMAAKIYARRTFRELEFMDYFQCASVGLIEAIERYNPAHGVSFETFASLRIKGAILSGVATLSEKQEQVSARRRVVDSRVQALNIYPATASPATSRPATTTAAKPEGEGVEDVFVQLAELAIGLALGFALEDTGMVQAEEVPHYQDNSYQRLEMKQLKQQLHHLLAALPSNENRVLTYHYLQHLGFAEIARILKVSAGRISQIHKAALTRLRDTMQVRNRIDLHY
jgi:RNA polymerase sigma factor FliA